jgi:hypothetical protein
MAKFHGKIGYVQTEETSPGVHSEVITERVYKGDLLRNSQKWENGDNLNPNFNINNRFSIVADAYAYENFPYIRYIYWMGTKWEVNSVTVDRPRLILTVRGVYNG